MLVWRKPSLPPPFPCSNHLRYFHYWRRFLQQEDIKYAPGGGREEFGGASTPQSVVSHRLHNPRYVHERPTLLSSKILVSTKNCFPGKQLRPSLLPRLPAHIAHEVISLWWTWSPCFCWWSSWWSLVVIVLVIMVLVIMDLVARNFYNASLLVIFSSFVIS